MKRCDLKITFCGSCSHPEIMTRKDAGLSPAEFPSLVGIIEHPEEGVILFDTGYDAAFYEATRTFPERLYRWATPFTLPAGHGALDQLKKLGYAARDVRQIIISHFHGDHISGLHNFPNAKITCARKGVAPVYEGGRFSRVSKGILSSLAPEDMLSRAQFLEDCPRVALPPELRPFSDAADILNDGSILAVELPGHCPGHWGIVLRAQDDQFVFLVADAAWSIHAIEGNIPPPKITMKMLGCTPDYHTTLSSLQMLHQHRRDVFIVPSHCRKAANRFEEKST